MCYSQYICPCTSVSMVALHPYCTLCNALVRFWAKVHLLCLSHCLWFEVAQSIEHTQDGILVCEITGFVPGCANNSDVCRLVPIYMYTSRIQNYRRVKSPTLEHNTVTSACTLFQPGVVDLVFNAPTTVIDGEQIFTFVIRKSRMNAGCSWVLTLSSSTFCYILSHKIMSHLPEQNAKLSLYLCKMYTYH